jgi:hypothetical protein
MLLTLSTSLNMLSIFIFIALPKTGQVPQFGVRDSPYCP